MILRPPIHRASFLQRLQGCFLGEPKHGPLPGGRTEALRRLRDYDPSHYGQSRNFLDGSVSRLSAYLRHGMLSPVEVREFLQSAFPKDPARREEFLRQLAWRDFFEKVLSWYGRGLENDLEEPKHRVTRYHRMPLDVLQGETGLPCIDGMLSELFSTGYLHNHARLWFAAYLCHFRGVRWQEGAQLFRQHLYDGDIASNSSSWQWVESTFSSKPYFANKDNIAKFSGGRWCNACRVKCPFEADYPTLQHRLFAGSSAPMAKPTPAAESKRVELSATDTGQCLGPLPPASDLVWVHDAAMSWEDPALKANPEAAVAFVFDEPALRAEPWAYHRLAFVLEGLEDLFEHLPNPTKLVLVGAPADQLAVLANALGASTVHLSEHPNPTVLETAIQLQKGSKVIVHSRPVFAEYSQEPKRFSRYWERVAQQVLGYRPKSARRMH
ncbi:hypothetical protein KIH39_22935 [Telmatocola sphagniphila]|uniref:Cryptochrome/DNA photolyase FAD-binding domain-containing protein n=1 Tax=Telmatocola sphagniphila TaxID=1123043 RepID=A0A8E6ESZ4_9BACT|nr:FAD-binding domain-containing protein [Telmatocola sphagniphila]QVL31669.1 hypothetical protein KIH39_22935 [Telmatocola sphagniphila]